MIEIPISWCGELERAEADIVQRLVIDAVRFVSVFHQLMHRERGVVGLHHRVGHFG